MGDSIRMIQWISTNWSPKPMPHATKGFRKKSNFEKISGAPKTTAILGTAPVKVRWPMYRGRGAEGQGQSEFRRPALPGNAPPTYAARQTRGTSPATMPSAHQGRGKVAVGWCPFIAICQLISIAFGSAPRREADSQPISHLVRQAVSFGFFFNSRLGFMQWGGSRLSEQTTVEW